MNNKDVRERTSSSSLAVRSFPSASKALRVLEILKRNHSTLPNELPPMRLLKAYQKLRLYVPSDLGYILACKLMAGRPEKDLADIEALWRTLGIQNRAQAQSVVDQYFPSPIHQAAYLLPRTLDGIFGK